MMRPPRLDARWAGRVTRRGRRQLPGGQRLVQLTGVVGGESSSPTITRVGRIAARSSTLNVGSVVTIAMNFSNSSPKSPGRPVNGPRTPRTSARHHGILRELQREHAVVMEVGADHDQPIDQFGPAHRDDQGDDPAVAPPTRCARPPTTASSTPMVSFAMSS